MPRLAVPVAIILLVGFASAFGQTYTVTVQTDMSSYTGSATAPPNITVTGLVSPAPGPSTGVVLFIKAPNGAVVDFDSVPVNATTGAYKDVFVAGGTGNWTTGAYTVNATWGGPSGSASSITTFNYVAPMAKTSTTLTCSTPITVGSPSTCTATVTGASGTIAGEKVTVSQTGGTGTVTLPSPPTCSLSAGGACTTTVIGATAGSVTLSAAYLGDSSNMASSGAASLVILTSTTTTVACAPSTVAIGATSTCTATVAGATGTVTGEVVAFSLGSSSTGGLTLPSPPSCALGSTETCSIMVIGKTVGSVTMVVLYPGDANNGMSSGNTTLTVQPAATTTTTASTSTTTTSTTASTTSSSLSTTSTSTSSTATVTTVTATQTVTQTQSSSSSKTSSSQSTSASPGIVIGATTIYAIVAVVVIVLALVGVMMWRRKVASDYERGMASRK